MRNTRIARRTRRGGVRPSASRKPDGRTVSKFRTSAPATVSLCTFEPIVNAPAETQIASGGTATLSPPSLSPVVDKTMICPNHVDSGYFDVPGSQPSYGMNWYYDNQPMTKGKSSHILLAEVRGFEGEDRLFLAVTRVLDR